MFKLPIFIHQLDTAYAGATGLSTDDSRLPFSEMWVKAIDGQTWMANFDTHALAVSGLGALKALRTMYGAQGIRLVPWGVPHLREPGIGSTATAEGALAGRIAAACDGLFLLDLEPPEYDASNGATYYCRTDLGANGDDVRLFVAAFLANGGRELQIVPDARAGRLVLFTDWWALDQVTKAWGQDYWTDFGLGYRGVIDRSIATLTAAGVHRVENIGVVLPANATPADLAAAAQYAHDAGCGAVAIWQRANLTPAGAAAIAALPDPWAPVASPPSLPQSNQNAALLHIVAARQEIDAAAAAIGG